jgi:hypothetical protein
LFILIYLPVRAQKMSAYRSDKNPYYWKNRKPDAAYWQQDVYYNIRARVDETTNIIDASQDIEYWNNSPDTLNYIFFHLYENAFVRGSYLHGLEKEKGLKPKLGKYEAAGLGTTVGNIKVDGATVRTELDNTILKVYLQKPLSPGANVRLSMTFKTYFDNGSTRRRMHMYPAWGFMHYDGVQWFPKVCVYDRKFGWDTYQHLNKEFYGEFGVFDVALDFASNYIVEATGNLANRKEVLPDELREKLDIKNFATKPWDEPPSTIIPYDKDQRKIWKYHAENVHDFAFTGDPCYRIATTYWNGIECVGIAQEPHCSGWQNSADYVRRIIQTFSEDVGMFGYPKMVAADANDGMEYPMITMAGGRDPGYHSLLVHEIGHNWFYGMVGSNETYRAAMDEGFTQFLTAWGMERIDGKNPPPPPRSKYRRKFFEPGPTIRDQRVFNNYTITALNQKELPLNTHSNDFNDALAHEGGYGLVYYKTATMLYNLQYSLGDSLFHAAFRHYFDQWKFAHPYFEDFRASIIQFTHADLNWFFDEWLETTKTLDYGVTGIRKLKGTDSFAITFRREGTMQMPLDFTVTAKDGSMQSYYVPNTWFTKSTTAVLLPKWYGWSKIQPVYTATIHAPSGVSHVRIDTSDRLADINMLDNYRTKGFPFVSRAFQVKLDGGINSMFDRKHYKLYVRPDLWWNLVDGIKAGVHLEGDYLSLLHRVDASIWWNTHVLQGDKYQSLEGKGQYNKYAPLNFSFNYASPVSLKYINHEEQLTVRYLDGMWLLRIGHNWKLNDNASARFFYQAMWSPDSNALDYLLYPAEWSSLKKRPNNSINIVLTRTYQKPKVTGSAVLTLRAPLLTGNRPDAFNYGYIEMNNTNYCTLDKLQLRLRVFARMGMGTNIPAESALWLGGANPEELMENKYTRSTGFVPDDWQGISRYETNHFQQGGGLNLRGYAGYFVADERDGAIFIGYKGRSGAAINAEADVDEYIKLQPKLTRKWLHVDVYGFADAGLIELSRINSLNEYYNSIPTEMWSDLRIDAGLGLAFTIKSWGVFEKAKPLTLRFDMPLFVNRPPYANPQYGTFRWLVGINRTF